MDKLCTPSSEIKSEIIDEIVKAEPPEEFACVLECKANSNPLLHTSITLPDENMNEGNIVKNRACSDSNEDSENEDIVMLSKKRKLGSKPNKNHSGKAMEKTEKLIEIVRNYAALYDPSHAQYKNIKTKNKIWDCIANVMEEKDGETVKVMWENLKDGYSEYLRANSAAAEQVTINRHIESNAWPWADQMLFLQPFIDCFNTPVVTQTEIKSSQRENTLIGSSINPCGAFQEESTLFNQHFLPDELSQSNNINDYIHQKTVAEYDETSLIFLGYAKILNKMSLQLQAKVKFEFAKIMMQAEVESASEQRATSNVRDVNTMSVAVQDCAVIITQPEAAAAIICAPPMNIQGGKDLPQSYIDDPKRNKAEAEKTERLIEIVKNYAVLYDTSHSGYRNNNKKNKIWENIAEVIGEKDGKTVKKKWTQLRDSYSTYLRSNKVASGQLNKRADRHNPCPFVDQMTFFRPFVECLANTLESET